MDNLISYQALKGLNAINRNVANKMHIRSCACQLAIIRKVRELQLPSKEVDILLSNWTGVYEINLTEEQVKIIQEGRWNLLKQKLTR